MSGLTLLDALAEARIEEAIARGELDGLPGAGRSSSTMTDSSDKSGPRRHIPGTGWLSLNNT